MLFKKIQGSGHDAEFIYETEVFFYFITIVCRYM